LLPLVVECVKEIVQWKMCMMYLSIVCHLDNSEGIKAWQYLKCKVVILAAR
jgi:hypothetical protein